MISAVTKGKVLKTMLVVMFTMGAIGACASTDEEGSESSSGGGGGPLGKQPCSECDASDIQCIENCY